MQLEAKNCGSVRAGRGTFSGDIISRGGVSEWFKVPLSKSGAAIMVAVGSNPTSSALLVFGKGQVANGSAPGPGGSLCITAERAFLSTSLSSGDQNGRSARREPEYSAND